MKLGLVVFAVLAAPGILAGCGGGYSPVGNTVAARSAARLLEACATDDAGTCTPSRVRAESELEYCANAHELVVHGAPVPEAGVACQAK